MCACHVLTTTYCLRKKKRNDTQARKQSKIEKERKQRCTACARARASERERERTNERTHARARAHTHVGFPKQTGKKDDCLRERFKKRENSENKTRRRTRFERNPKGAGREGGEKKEKGGANKKIESARVLHRRCQRRPRERREEKKVENVQENGRAERKKNIVQRKGEIKRKREELREERNKKVALAENER